MAKTFASKKFHSLLLANTMAMVVDFLVFLSDNIIAGNMLGENALSAITLVAPVFSLVICLSLLIATGTSAVISSEVGRGSRESANLYFSQGLILSAGLSGLLTAAFFAARPWLVPFFGVSGEVAGYVSEYFFYLCFLPFPLVFLTLFYNILLNEGGESYAVVSIAVQFFGNIALSLFLCSRMGIGGIGLASVASMSLALIVLVSFLFSGNNPFRFRWHIALHSVLHVVKYGIAIVSFYFYAFLMPSCMNLFLLYRFGTEGVVVFSVVVGAMMLMLAVFDGIGESVQPLLSVYGAEGCQAGICKSMECASRMALIEGVTATLALLIAADYIPGLFGIVTPHLVEEASAAIRIFALSACPAAFITLYVAYFSYMGKVAYSAFVVMLYNLGLPLATGFGLGLLFGLRGVWAAFTITGVVAMLVCMLGARRLYGAWERFPLLDSERLRAELSYDVPKTPESVNELVARVERDLTARNLPRSRIMKIMMMIDSTEMYSMEEGVEEGAIIECNILPGDPLTLILRDTGEKNEVMSEGVTSVPSEEPETVSLNYICRVMLGTSQNRRHIKTGGKNRSIFQIGDT